MMVSREEIDALLSKALEEREKAVAAQRLRRAAELQEHLPRMLEDISSLIKTKAMAGRRQVEVCLPKDASEIVKPYLQDFETDWGECVLTIRW